MSVLIGLSCDVLCVGMNLKIILVSVEYMNVVMIVLVENIIFYCVMNIENSVLSLNDSVMLIVLLSRYMSMVLMRNCCRMLDWCVLIVIWMLILCVCLVIDISMMFIMLILLMMSEIIVISDSSSVSDWLVFLMVLIMLFMLYVKKFLWLWCWIISFLRFFLVVVFGCLLCICMVMLLR